MLSCVVVCGCLDVLVGARQGDTECGNVHFVCGCVWSCAVVCGCVRVLVGARQGDSGDVLHNF